MENRIDNLGDYNKMRLDLQKMGGNLADHYEKIGNIKNKPSLKKQFEGMARDGPVISDNVSKNRDLKEME